MVPNNPNPNPNPIRNQPPPIRAGPSTAQSPFEIGRSDLDHIATLDPLRSLTGGQNPNPLNTGGGMMVGFDHPLFQERFGNNSIYGDESDFNRGGIGGLGEGMRFGPEQGMGGGGGEGLRGMKVEMEEEESA